MADGQAQTSISQPNKKGRTQFIRSSLPYQILLYLNGWYFAFFFVCEILLFVFKGETLPYATNVLAAEVILLFLLAIVEALRLFFGKRGNLTEQIMGVLVCVFLSIATIFGVLFFLLWQTYVLRVEIILTAIQLFFIGMEIIFGIISIITFAKYDFSFHSFLAILDHCKKSYYFKCVSFNPIESKELFQMPSSVSYFPVCHLWQNGT